ncbi:MAG: flagellar hook protein FlgE [Phycisphaerales bacterium]
MASTTALFTGLSGLNANARLIDVIGNNISNVNTTAYKSNRVMFGSMFNRTFSIGSAPGVNSGGTNPGQIGLGVQASGTQRNFGNGAINATGDSRDLAIEGDGFFVVQGAGGEQVYTRAGSFRPNSSNQLVTLTGERLMGYGVDAKFNLDKSAINPVSIPLGSLTIAEPTTVATLQGNLNKNGALPTHGASVTLQGSASAGLGVITGASPAPTGTDLVETSTRLVDLDDPAIAGTTTALFAPGQTIRITGAQKGLTSVNAKNLPDSTLAITSSTTLQDLMDFVQNAYGIIPGQTNPDGATTGVTLNPATGAISIVGNTGTMNDITLNPSNMQLLDSSGNQVKSSLFNTTKAAAADGESVRTSFVAYDSLGTPVNINVGFALESTPGGTGSNWRYYAEAGNAYNGTINLGSGVVSFGTSGALLTTTPLSVSVDRSGTGAITPLNFSIQLTSGSGGVTAFANTSGNSSLQAQQVDGAAIGTLQSFGVGDDGVITGAFTNGLSRTLGQVVLAKFSNPEGLVDLGNNLYRVGPNSGTAGITSPLDLGTGKIVGGALELSNVDLGSEFLGLILAQTGYSASTRVIRTTDDLFQQLLSLGR